jgi:hypothetical protein
MKLDKFQKNFERIKYNSYYKINETPNYKALIGEEEFDEVPKEAFEDNEIPTKQEPTVPIEPTTNDEPTDKPNSDLSNLPNELNQEVIAPPQENPQTKVDNIQNDIIKTNLEAVKNIADQMDSLNNTINQLNNKLDVLSSDVEEVREPSNSEKLMSKTNVSYPYYLNLNDYWKGNTFHTKSNPNQNNGMRELPDGTYVADFDDLPKHSDFDIKNSFDSII